MGGRERERGWVGEGGRGGGWERKGEGMGGRDEEEEGGRRKVGQHT